MKSILINYSGIPEKTFLPVQPVLSRNLQQELHRLADSLRSQVRNAIAVNNWLQRQKTSLELTQEVAVNLNQLQNPVTDSLTFRFVSSPEAFKLFTDTLVRKSYFLHYQAEVDSENQLLKVRLNAQQLPEWEQELSILFENITIAVYLQTLLYHQQQSKLLKRKAS